MKKKRKKNRVKARQDIGCKFGLRPNLLLTLAFAASFFRFVRSALSVLSYSGEYGSPIKTGTRSYIILSLYEKRKKLSTFGRELSLFHPKRYQMLDRRRLSICHNSITLLPSRNFVCPRAIGAEESDPRPSFSKLEGKIGNSGRRRAKKKAPEEGSERGAKSYTSVGGRGGQEDVHRRVETCGEKGEGRAALFHSLPRVEDFLPSPPRDSIDDIRESAHVSSITATS